MLSEKEQTGYVHPTFLIWGDERELATKAGARNNLYCFQNMTAWRRCSGVWHSRKSDVFFSCFASLSCNLLDGVYFLCCPRSASDGYTASCIINIFGNSSVEAVYN